MAQLIAKEKQLQAQKEQRVKVEAERSRLLNRFLAPDALTYLSSIRKSNPPLAKQIEDVVLYLIVYRGIRQIFSQIDIRYIERQITGEGPKIRVQRDGETTDFGSFVRDAIRKSSDD